MAIINAINRAERPSSTSRDRADSDPRERGRYTAEPVPSGAKEKFHKFYKELRREYPGDYDAHDGKPPDSILAVLAKFTYREVKSEQRVTGKPMGRGQFRGHRGGPKGRGRGRGASKPRKWDSSRDK